MKKAQSSLEFLIILGIAFVFILMLGGVFFSFSNSSQKSLNSEQIEKVGNELMTNIEKIYFRGVGNKIQYKANLPEDILNMTIHYKKTPTTNFTYLNITRYDKSQISSQIFFPRENYIQFICANCSNTSPIDYSTNFTLYFEEEDFSPGRKTLAITSLQERVELKFIK